MQEKTDCGLVLDLYFKAKACVLSSGVSMREMISLHWLIFRMESKHFRLLLAKV